MKVKYNNRKELENALFEAAIQKKHVYENMKFVDNIFKGDKTLVESIKNKLKKKTSPKKIYNYLIESGCASKYDDLAEYMDFPNESDILFDLEEDHEWGELGQDHDDYREDEYERYDDDDDPFGLMDDEFERGEERVDDEITDLMLKKPDDRSADMRDFPNVWEAKKNGITKRYTLTEGFDENKFRAEVERLQKEGYEVSAVAKK